jgi:hypothetical protein
MDVLVIHDFYTFSTMSGEMEVKSRSYYGQDWNGLWESKMATQRLNGNTSVEWQYMKEANLLSNVSVKTAPLLSPSNLVL